MKRNFPKKVEKSTVWSDFNWAKVALQSEFGDATKAFLRMVVDAEEPVPDASLEMPRRVQCGNEFEDDRRLQCQR